MPRPLRSSERRLALFAGDAVALTSAVLVALWTWSLTAGFPLDLTFLRTRALWFASVPLWLLVLVSRAKTRRATDIVAAGLPRPATASCVGC